MLFFFFSKIIQLSQRFLLSVFYTEYFSILIFFCDKYLDFHIASGLLCGTVPDNTIRNELGLVRIRHQTTWLGLGTNLQKRK